MVPLLLYSSILILGLLDTVDSFIPAKKAFNANANFGNPANWVPAARPPCQNDVIEFRDDAQPALFIAKNATLPNKVTLFTDGAIYFGDETEITFADVSINEPVIDRGQSSECSMDGKGEYVKYVGDDRKYFHDPFNWDTLTRNEEYQPLLHAEMIPSQFDVAAFSDSATFSVTIEAATTVKFLLVGEMNFTTETFADYIANEGSLQFDASSDLNDIAELEMDLEGIPNMEPLITVQREDCTERSGCKNINFEQDTIDLICSHVRCSDLPLPCASPVKPLGHCCSICGSIITFDASSAFNFLDFTQDYWEVYSHGKEMYKLSSQKIDDSKYQIVVAPVDWSALDFAAFAGYTSEIRTELQRTRGVKLPTIETQLSTNFSEVGNAILAAFLFVCLLVFGTTAASYVVLQCRAGQLRYAWLTIQPQIFFWRGKDDDQVRFEMTENIGEDDLGQQSSAALIAPTRKHKRSTERSARVPASNVSHSQSFANPSYCELISKDELHYISPRLEEQLVKANAGRRRSSQLKPTASAPRLFYESTSSSSSALTFDNPIYNEHQKETIASTDV